MCQYFPDPSLSPPPMTTSVLKMAIQMTAEKQYLLDFHQIREPVLFLSSPKVDGENLVKKRPQWLRFNPAEKKSQHIFDDKKFRVFLKKQGFLYSV